jgi:hypothetical protein
MSRFMWGLVLIAAGALLVWLGWRGGGFSGGVFGWL